MYPLSKQIALIVCDTQKQAESAAGHLEGMGFSMANITIETVSQSVDYDANTNDGGVVDMPSGKWLVIGRLY